MLADFFKFAKICHFEKRICFDQFACKYICYVIVDFTVYSILSQNYVATKCYIVFTFFRRFERAIRKRPNTVRCLAVKNTLLGTRHPRKEKEAALQKIIGEPACLCGEITMCHSIGDGTKH